MRLLVLHLPVHFYDCMDHSTKALIMLSRSDLRGKEFHLFECNPDPIIVLSGSQGYCMAWMACIYPKNQVLSSRFYEASYLVKL